MNLATASRLWPVLSTLVVLIASAIALEIYAHAREPRAIVVAIRVQERQDLSGDEDGDEHGDDPAAETAAPISPAHAAARELGRRGDLAGAIAALEREIAVDPTRSALYSDLGYLRLVEGQPKEAEQKLSRARDLGSSSPTTFLNLGVALRRLKDMAGSEAALRRALELRPNFYAARLALATVMRRSRRFDEAIALLEVLATSGGNSARAEALIGLGRAQLEAGRGQAAEQSFARAIEWAPAQAEIRISAARAYLARGSAPWIAKARAIAELAAELAPDLAEAHGTLGRARELSGDEQSAEDSYETALRLRPDYHYARRRLLRLALQSHDYARARAHAERLLAQAPHEPQHLFLAGLADARAGQPEQARTHYLAAIDASGGNYPEAYFNLGLLEKAAGHAARAIEAYQKAIELRPDYLEALNNLGLLHASRDDHAAAEETYRTALARDARYLPAWINLGKSRLHRQAYTEAIDALVRAVAVRPGSQEALLNLGVAYRRAERVDDAIATYRKLLAAQPRYVSAWYNLGVALESAHRGREALDCYEQALKLDDAHVRSLARSARLRMQEGDLEVAGERCETLLDHDPGNRDARMLLADIRRRQGDSGGCAAAVTAALAGLGRDATGLLMRCGKSELNEGLSL